MGTLVAVTFLATFSLTLGQLIVPQDIAIGQQHGTLSGLTQFSAKGSEVINDLASPQELLVESLSPSHHERQKSNTIQRKFPAAPTSDLLGVADVQKPKKDTNQGKPPDLDNRGKFAPLPVGVDFLSTSISSQEIIEMPSRSDKKGKGHKGSRNWKNLVKSNPRQVGDRFDIVIEKRMNGNELSSGTSKSKSKKNRFIKDKSVDTAQKFLHEPELPWLNAAVEATPDHEWTDNTIIRSSIGPLKMSEVSAPAVKMTKAKTKSNVNEIVKSTSTNLLNVGSTPNPVAAMNSNTEKHVTHSFHLKTTNKKVRKPVTPSTVGWTSWVEPAATETSTTWFEGRKSTPDVTTDKELKTESEVNSLHSPIKENETTTKSLSSDLAVKLPPTKVLQKPQSKGFFASWRPWTGTSEQTTHQNVASSDTGNTDQHETVPMSTVTAPTILQHTANKNKDISSDLGNQPANTELVSNARNAENANHDISSDLGNQTPNTELATDVQNTENAIHDIISDLRNQIAITELVKDVQNTENVNEGINTDLGNEVSNIELYNNMQNTDKSNPPVTSDLDNQIVNTDLVNNVPYTENANIGSNSDLGNQIVNPESVDMINPSIEKQIVNSVNIESTISGVTAKETVNPELLKDVLPNEAGRLELHTESVKTNVSTLLTDQATSPKVLGFSELLDPNTLLQDESKDASKSKHSKPTELPVSQTNGKVNEKDEKAGEVIMPPTSNFDPLFLPPVISAGVADGFQPEEFGHSSAVQSNTHMGTSSLGTDEDHNGARENFPELGRPGVSQPKRHFFVSPSPADLIPPQEHLHEGILFPIEPHVPSEMVVTEHSTSQNTEEKLGQETKISSSHNRPEDNINSLIGHEGSKSDKISLEPHNNNNFHDKIHRTHTVKSGINANSIWNTKEISKQNPAELIQSNHLSTSSSSTDQAKERNILLEQIREALINLNGATGMIKPLDGMNPLSNEPGLTHALIGSVGDFADIPGTNAGLGVGRGARTQTDAKTDQHENHHHLDKHMDNSHSFHDHNSFHKLHSLTDLSGHITLDEKAIRQKLLSPEKTFNHLPSHMGHAPHDAFHSAHLGMTDSLSRADIDLSQDLSKNPMLNTPITIRNLQRHIEDSNRESAKLRFFTNPKRSENVINHKSTHNSKMTEEENKPNKEKNSHPTTTTQTPPIKPTEEHGLLINNNSIFFDPNTNKPVDPFNNVSSDVLQNAHHAWEDAVAKVKTHIDPIPEIAAVVGDKKNAIRVGSVSSFRVGEIPKQMKQEPQPPHDPNAAFHFLDPVTNAVVPIAALPDDSSNDNVHVPSPHQSHDHDMDKMFGHSLSNGDKPIPFINPMQSAGDINSEDGFFVGPILFGPVDDPPPNGDIEISGPVLAMGLSPADDKNGNHGHHEIDVKKILEGIFKNKNQQRNTKKKTLNSHFSDLSNRTSSKSTHTNASKAKLVKPISLRRIDINPLQQVLGGSKRNNMLPSTHFPVPSGLRHSKSTHASKQRVHATHGHSSKTHSGKGISKGLLEALANILKANKRKEFLSKQKVSTSFQKSFPSAIRKNNIIQRPAQKHPKRYNKIDMQKIINLLKARQKLFGLKKKLTAPKTAKKQHTLTSISKPPLGGRSQIPTRSVIKPISLPKHDSMSTLRSPSSTNSEHFRNKRYQLLLQLMKNRRLNHNPMMTNVPNLRSNLRSSHINSAARPAQRTIGHSSVNTDSHRFIPKINSAHRSSVVRPIPLSTIHRWPFSAPVASQHPSINTHHFLPRHRVWPQNQIQH